MQVAHGRTLPKLDGCRRWLLGQAIWPAYTYNCTHFCLQRLSIKITPMMNEGPTDVRAYSMCSRATRENCSFFFQLTPLFFCKRLFDCCSGFTVRAVSGLESRSMEGRETGQNSGHRCWIYTVDSLLACGCLKT